MEHSFDIEVAKKLGVNCAVIMKHIYFWVEKNKANEKNFHDGRYWTYNSVKAFEEIFPYMTTMQIRTALGKLEANGLIECGCYNTDPYDKTKWYTVTEYAEAICKNQQIDLLSATNRFDASNKSNKYNNDFSSFETDINTNISEIDDFFEKIWALYPRKLGKSSISKSKKKELYKVGYDALAHAIERYKEEVRGREKQFILYGSSFFNTNYKDYLDENYETENIAEPVADDPFSCLQG